MIKLKNLSLSTGEHVAETGEFDEDSKEIIILWKDNDFIKNNNFTLYAMDEKDRYYTFFDCNKYLVINTQVYNSIHIYGNYYLGEKVQSETFDTQKMKVTLCYNNLISEESIQNLKIENLEEFNINVFKDKYYFFIEISSATLQTNEKFKKMFFTYFEIFLLMHGKFPEIFRIEYEYNEGKVREFFAIANKYVDENRARLSVNSPLFMITDITKDNLRAWEEIRDETALSVFMVTCSCEMYIELRLALFLQCTEGIGRNIFQLQGEYWKILNDLFMESPCVRQLFSRDELAEIPVDHGKAGCKEAKILNQAKEHRHYFSHLAKNRSRLTATQCVYFFAKFSLGLRIRLCEKIGIDVDTQSVQDIVKMIDG